MAVAVAKRTYFVTFSIDVPEEVTEEQFLEWLKYKLGETCEMSCDNPLCDRDMDARHVQIIARG